MPIKKDDHLLIPSWKINRLISIFQRDMKIQKQIQTQLEQ